MELNILYSHMKKLSFHPSLLQISYFIIYIVLFAFIIYTPTLIKGPVYLTKKLIIEEEIIEGSLLCILLFLSILILNLYRREVIKHKELIRKIDDDRKITEGRLFDSFNYIGKVNVQIQEIKSIFNASNRYPETKNEFKKTFHFLSERVLGIVNANWVLFRIINNNTQKTLSECFETRQDFSCNYPLISNKMIIEKQPIPFTTVISHPQNLNILVYCALPIDKISNDQRIFIQAILNEITMLFVIFNSLYYKNGNKILAEK
jgi:hypothetical protein